MEPSNAINLSLWNPSTSEDVNFAEVIKEAERAIDAGVLPVRISVGSSGSYFVRNLEGV